MVLHRRELLPRDQYLYYGLYYPRVRESKATQTVPGSAANIKAAGCLMMALQQLRYQHDPL
jgi:hypothetical protein